MSRLIHVELFAAMTVVIFASADANAQESPNPIAKVDHFYAQSPRAQQLHEFLHGELLLPEVWPFSDYGTFSSGGLSLGNVVFEVIRRAGVDDSQSEGASFQGIAFEPMGSASSAVA